jgi:hypothetical protein
MKLTKSRSLNAKDLIPGNRKNGNPLKKGLKFDNVKRQKLQASVCGWSPFSKAKPKVSQMNRFSGWF